MTDYDRCRIHAERESRGSAISIKNNADGGVTLQKIAAIPRISIWACYITSLVARTKQSKNLLDKYALGSESSTGLLSHMIASEHAHPRLSTAIEVCISKIWQIVICTMPGRNHCLEVTGRSPHPTTTSAAFWANARVDQCTAMGFPSRF